MKFKQALARHRRAIPLLVLAAAVLIFAGALAAGRVAATVAARQNVNVEKNNYAAVDYSNLSEGYISVAYTAGGSQRIKVQITKSGGTTYTYNLNNTGTAETFPLTESDGSYTIKVFRNTTGNKYAQLLACTLDMKLRNEFLPFLYPNQYVNFNSDSKVVAKAEELCAGKTSDMDKLTAIYNYVVNNFTYDKELAATVQSGYLPDVDKVLEAKKGICFDYAAVMSAMLRSQNIPCKLVVGYAGTVYHAWVNVYIEGTGWIANAIFFDGENWTLMDPTFASSGHSSASIMKYIGDGSNYTSKYAY